MNCQLSYPNGPGKLYILLLIANLILFTLIYLNIILLNLILINFLQFEQNSKLHLLISYQKQPKNGNLYLHLNLYGFFQQTHHFYLQHLLALDKLDFLDHLVEQLLVHL